MDERKNRDHLLGALMSIIDYLLQAVGFRPLPVVFASPFRKRTDMSKLPRTKTPISAGWLADCGPVRSCGIQVFDRGAALVGILLRRSAQTCAFFTYLPPRAPYRPTGRRRGLRKSETLDKIFAISLKLKFDALTSPAEYIVKWCMSRVPQRKVPHNPRPCRTSPL